MRVAQVEHLTTELTASVESDALAREAEANEKWLTKRGKPQQTVTAEASSGPCAKNPKGGDVSSRMFPHELRGQGGNAGEGHPQIDRRTLERTRRLVAKVDTNPTLIQVAIENLKRWMARTEGAPNACDIEWATLLAEKPWNELREKLLEESDEGQRLRSSSPFAGVLTEEERRAVR